MGTFNPFPVRRSGSSRGQAADAAHGCRAQMQQKKLEKYKSSPYMQEQCCYPAAGSLYMHWKFTLQLINFRADNDCPCGNVRDARK
eukprot:1157737-Pelagomonas_calceolata.AAC.9